MRKLQLFSILLLSVMILALSSSSVQADYGEGVSDHCTTPTEFRTVIAAPSGTDTDLSFDTTEISVPENTCVEITFINKAPTVDHDFVIDSLPGDSGINFVDIHVDNSTAGEYNNGTETFHIQTNLSNTFTFYCSIGDHRSQGMEGTFVVGTGVSESGLSFNPFFTLGSIAIIALTIINRKRN